MLIIGLSDPLQLRRFTLSFISFQWCSVKLINGNISPDNKPAQTPREPPRPTAAQKKLELAKRTQGLLAQNVVNQKLILSKLESCKVLSEKRSMLETMKKLQLSHDTIKASLASIENNDRKRKAPHPVKQAPATTLGASTNLDLRPKEIIVKNCNNAEELHEHFR